ncbi:MAG: ABC transporter permease, partial [Bacteroidota bacterium]
MAVELDVQTNIEKREGEKPWRDFWRRFRRNRTAMVGLIILSVILVVALFPNWFAPFDYKTNNMMESLQPPSAKHLLGTDEIGRDILSRIIYGARLSLRVGVESVFLSLLIGIIL